jgi:hypothetical protein
MPTVVGAAMVVSGAMVVSANFVPWVSSPDGCSLPGQLIEDGSITFVIGWVVAGLGALIVAVRPFARWGSRIVLLATLVLGVVVRIDTRHLGSLCSSGGGTAEIGVYALVAGTGLAFLAATVGLIVRPPDRASPEIDALAPPLSAGLGATGDLAGSVSPSGDRANGTHHFSGVSALPTQ